MYDAAGMGEGERIDHVVEDADDLASRKRFLSLDRDAERLAVDERHRVPEQIAVLARREQWNDVRMLELRGDLDLSAETLAIDAGRQIRRKHFDDDAPVERAIDCREDAAHAAAGQLVVELIGRAERILQLVGEFSHQSLIYARRD